MAKESIYKYLARISLEASGSLAPQVQGGEAVSQALEQTAQTISGPVVRKGMNAGGVEITAAVRRHIHSVSGLLAAGTRVRAGRGDQPGRYSVYMSSQTTANRYATRGRTRKVAAGAGSRKYRIWHWPAVEYEHRIVTNKGNDTGKTVAAHPFVRPGFDESIDGAMDIVETTVLDDAVEKFG